MNRKEETAESEQPLTPNISEDQIVRHPDFARQPPQKVDLTGQGSSSV